MRALFSFRRTPVFRMRYAFGSKGFAYLDPGPLNTAFFGLVFLGFGFLKWSSRVARTYYYPAIIWQSIQPAFSRQGDRYLRLA
jgi:hypothetical protein